MQHHEFEIGSEFWTGGSITERRIWRCTDIGKRVIVAIRVDAIRVDAILANTDIDGEIRSRWLNRNEAETEGWFNGPPYAVSEMVFDEDDMPACKPA